MDINKKLNEMFGKMDERVLKAKIAEAMNMMKGGKQEELSKIIEKADKQEIMDKLKGVDKDTMKKMNMNIDELKSKLSEEDFKKIKDILK